MIELTLDELKALEGAMNDYIHSWHSLCNIQKKIITAQENTK